MPAAVTDADRRTYRRDGVVALRGVLPTTLVEALAGPVEQALADATTTTDLTAMGDALTGDADDDPSRGRFRSGVDHWRHSVNLIESVRTLGMTVAELDAAYDAAVERVEQAVHDLAQPLAYTPVEPPTPDDDLPTLESTMGNGTYQRAVEVAKEHVIAGDIFQVVLAQRYDLQLDADPFDVYRVLRQVNPSP